MDLSFFMTEPAIAAMDRTTQAKRRDDSPGDRSQIDSSSVPSFGRSQSHFKIKALDSKSDGRRRSLSRTVARWQFSKRRN